MPISPRKTWKKYFAFIFQLVQDQQSMCVWVLEYVEPAECEQMGPAGSVLPEICLTRVHNEIHDIQA